MKKKDKNSEKKCLVLSCIPNGFKSYDVAVITEKGFPSLIICNKEVKTLTVIDASIEMIEAGYDYVWNPEQDYCYWNKHHLKYKNYEKHKDKLRFQRII